MSNRFFPNYNTYRITSEFGMRKNPVDGVTRMHNGIDLVASKTGKDSYTDYITAHSGGVVDAAGYDSASGNYVRIKVMDGVYMVYCHLKNKSALKKGDKVKKGEVIGYMGSTGRSTAAHLHFGIKQDGVYVDPQPYLYKDFVKEAKTVNIAMNVLRNGANGEQVKTLQRLLIAMGYKMESNGKVYGDDGSFGGVTEKAVKAFQKANGLDADGVVGSATWNKLLKG